MSFIHYHYYPKDYNKIGYSIGSLPEMFDGVGDCFCVMPLP